MKKILLLLIVILCPQITMAQDAFTTIWNVSDFVPILTLPAQTSHVSYTIDWGDGTTDSTIYSNQNPTHTYAKGGEYDISITGNFSSLIFEDQPQLIGVKEWGTKQWLSMSDMFKNCENFNILPTTPPDLTLTYTMTSMFYGATSFNQPMNNWNMSNVRYMHNMFYEASSFNQDIGSWDMSNVESLFYMFYRATSFNGNIGNWNVSNVENMIGTFYGATSFNKDISNWNVSKVTHMTKMFYGATSFNKDIGNWNVENLKYTSEMFFQATSFNQSLGSWNISNILSMDKMFEHVTLSTENYDSILIGWPTTALNNGSALQSNVKFSAGNSTYCNEQDAREYLTDILGWTIDDAGINCSVLGFDDFETSLISIYPNPTSESLHIQISPELYNKPYKIIDFMGKTVNKGVIHNSQSDNINVSGLVNGTYLINLGGMKTLKFVKQ